MQLDTKEFKLRQQEEATIIFRVMALNTPEISISDQVNTHLAMIRALSETFHK